MTTLPNGRDGAPTNADGSLKMDNDWVPPPNFPKMVIQTLVEYNGKTWLVTFNDTSIDTAALAVERRGGTILGMGASSPNAPAATPTGAIPVCPYHGPMKESTIKGKEGTYYCSKKMADGSYCKEKG